MNDNVLGNDYNFNKLIKYTFPTILMMIFSSSYYVIDGVFVARFAGDIALSAINIIVPVFNLTFAIGLMLASGGTAIIGKLMGENNYDKANRFLSTLYLTGITLGILLSLVLNIFSENITLLLGADATLFSYANHYLKALSLFPTFFILQSFANILFVTAGKPKFGFLVSLTGGITNIVLDYVFISDSMLDLGIAGAGYATGIANLLPAIIAIIFFAFNKKGNLYFRKPLNDFKLIIEAMSNGVSELVTNLATAITTILVNVILLDLVGTIGVTAFTIILYVQLLQVGINWGYLTGVAPIISFKYGAQDYEGLRKVVSISMKFLFITGIIIVFLTFSLNDEAVMIFLSKDSTAYEISKQGLTLFSIGYIFSGVNMFMSSLFTSLSNGKVSAVLSFSRTFFFILIALLILPKFFGVVGVFLAIPVAEFCALILSMYIYKRYQKVYNY